MSLKKISEDHSKFWQSLGTNNLSHVSMFFANFAAKYIGSRWNIITNKWIEQIYTVPKNTHTRFNLL